MTNHSHPIVKQREAWAGVGLSTAIAVWCEKKQKRTPAPARGKLTVFSQLCNLVPGHMVAKLARKHGIDSMVRRFSAWSHVVALLFAQLTHAIGLNDTCDALRHHCGLLARIRGATFPSRNNLSHANKNRSAAMARDLFWDVLNHLGRICPAFGSQRRFKGLPGRFKRAIHLVDSTTIKLIVSCIDWARHRRRKAAVKCHLRMGLQDMLPRFVIIDSAAENDTRRARELCAGVQEGEIVVFDRGYLDFEHLHDLTRRGVNWVTRTKSNRQLRVVKKHARKGNILRDDTVVLAKGNARKKHPGRLRRILALVEVDGKLREMEFLTNNHDWSAARVCDLYKSRWQIEVFFKQIKQTLQLEDFMGNSANAVRWQVWTALLMYVLLRFEAFLSGWDKSFTRLFTLLRGVLWDRFDVGELLRFYGRAGGRWRMRAEPRQLYLPGMSP